MKPRTYGPRRCKTTTPGSGPSKQGDGDTPVSRFSTLAKHMRALRDRSSQDLAVEREELKRTLEATRHTADPAVVAEAEQLLHDLDGFEGPGKIKRF